MRSRWFIFCLLLGTGILGRAENLGSVQVTVLDAKEKPVQNAPVEMGRPMDAAPRPMCWTDKHGTCAFDHLPIGEYEAYIFNYKEGYPRPNPFYFGRNFKPTVVTLQESDPSQKITLHLGRRQDFLKLIVTDAVSGKPIMPVGFRISWTSDPDNTIETGRGDDLVVLVPPGVPLSLVASSDGYKDWQYTSADDAANHNLVLQSGESRILNIRLQPKR
jgi:hypothetical protein